jgi:RHS repeat-associated protein
VPGPGAAGHLVSQTDHGVTHAYSYDVQGQLTGDGTNTYSYDANGNRTGAGYVTGAGNELLSDGTWNYQYDNEGNVSKKVNIQTGETWVYGYDNKNELTSAKHRASDGGAVDEEVDYRYDAFGNRVEKDVDADGAGPASPQVTKFALDGWKNIHTRAIGNEAWDVWADLNADGSLATRYVHGDAIDQVFARIGQDRQASWYLTDQLGSVRDVLDGSGHVKDTISYDAFGNITSETDPAYGGRYKFTGREFDSETGLQYNRARYYDPHAGRWTSQDPMGFAAGDSNLYRYVNNDPTDATDPSGFVIRITTKDEKLKKEIFEMLKTLYPDGDLKLQANGDVELGKDFVPPAKSKNPKAAQAMTDLIKSDNVWRIIPDVADPKIPGRAMWPYTQADNGKEAVEKNGKAGKGTGGDVHTPTSRSKFEFGAYDPKGNAQKASNTIVLAHELFGHAWFMNQGKHDPRPQKRGDRPGHDQAIDMENQIRLELSGKKKLPDSELRGKFADPKKGESLWKKKGGDEWLERAPKDDDLKDWFW